MNKNNITQIELAHYHLMVKQANEKRKHLLRQRNADISKCEKCGVGVPKDTSFTFCEQCLWKEAENNWVEHVRLYKEMKLHEPQGQFFCCRCATYCSVDHVVTCEDCKGKQCARCKKNLIFACVFK